MFIKNCHQQMSSKKCNQQVSQNTGNQKWLTHSLSQWVSQWQGHLLSCQVTGKNIEIVCIPSPITNQPMNWTQHQSGNPICLSIVAMDSMVQNINGKGGIRKITDHWSTNYHNIYHGHVQDGGNKNHSFLWS